MKEVHQLINTTTKKKEKKIHTKWMEIEFDRD